jgi:hypothetical protein
MTQKEYRKRQARTCHRKVYYPNKWAARSAARHIKDRAGYNLKPYKCDVCSGYHLTKKVPNQLWLAFEQAGLRAGLPVSR